MSSRKRSRILSESHSNSQPKKSSSKKVRTKKSTPVPSSTTIHLSTLFSETLFTRTLTTCGVKCSNNHTLYCDEPYMLPRMLENALQDPGASEQFLNDVSTLLETSSTRNLLFVPLGETRNQWGNNNSSSNATATTTTTTTTTMAAATNSSSSSSSSTATPSSVATYGDSLARILLKMEVDNLQTGLIKALLDTLCNYAVNESGDESDGDGDDATMHSNSTTGVSLSTTILQHLRWLDFVEDATTLSTKLKECIEICPFDVRRDIILMLPEIVGDVELNELVFFLLELMEETPALTVAILDALTNLHLNDQCLHDATDRVILTLQSSEPADLPVVVRFLLTSCHEKVQIVSVLTSIRQYLSAAIESNGLAIAEEQINSASSETLILEALRIGLRQRYDVASIYLKGFTETDASGLGNGSAKSLDVWMLATMHSFPRDRQAVETTLKKLVIDHKLDDSTIDVAIDGHSAALSKNFESLVSLASMLVGATARKKSVAQDVRACGRTMFLHLFTSFELTYHRQEIVGKLMTHIGSGSKEEIDTALSVFVAMVDDEDYIDLLCPFSAFLRCLIDYVEHLSLSQVRKIFYVLCTMAEHSTANDSNADEDEHEQEKDSSGDAELNILLRKLLASTQAHYRAIGIVAGSAMVLAICSQEEKNQQNQKNQQKSNSSGSNTESNPEDADSQNSNISSQIALSPQNNKARKVLELMLSKGHDSANLEILHALYDEISMLITKGHQLVGSMKNTDNPLTQAVADWLELECVDKLTAEYLINTNSEEDGGGSKSNSNDDDSSSSSSSSSSSPTTIINRSILGSFQN